MYEYEYKCFRNEKFFRIPATNNDIFSINGLSLLRFGYTITSGDAANFDDTMEIELMGNKL